MRQVPARDFIMKPTAERALEFGQSARGTGSGHLGDVTRG